MMTTSTVTNQSPATLTIPVEEKPVTVPDDCKVSTTAQPILSKIDNPNAQHSHCGIKIIALRHGESTANKLGIITASDDVTVTRLTADGIGQVCRAAEKLKASASIDFIFSSPLQRTRETAAIVASSFNKKVVIEDRLKEPAYGEFEGKPFLEYLKLFSKPEDRFVTAPPKGESGEKLRERIAAFLKELGSDATYQNKTVLLVTHYYPIVHLCDLFGVPRVKEPFPPAGMAEFTLLPTEKTT
jgi:probable phosphoglycerate mutase